MHVQMASGCLMLEMAAATASESNHMWTMQDCHSTFITGTTDAMFRSEHGVEIQSNSWNIMDFPHLC